MHISRWGQGHEAVLRYLARYVFRVAITNTRIVARAVPPQSCAISGEHVRRLNHLPPLSSRHAGGPDKCRFVVEELGFDGRAGSPARRHP